MIENPFKFFFGIVVDALSDLTKQSVTVRIHGIHSAEIADNDLPYAKVLLPCTGGGISGLGENQQLESGAHVMGCFLDPGTCQLPIILNVVPQTAEAPAANQIVDGESAVLLSVRPSAKVFRKQETIGFIEANAPVGSSTLDYRKKVCWEFFSKKYSRYTSVRIAGIIGNLIVESDINPRKHQDFKQIGDGRGVGRGIAQWDSNPGGRWNKCIIFGSKRNVSEFELLLQLEFIDHELNTHDYFAGDFFRTTSVAGATMAFCRSYERPRDEGKPDNTTVSVNENNEDTWLENGGNHWNTKEGEQKRLNAANAVYREFTESRS